MTHVRQADISLIEVLVLLALVLSPGRAGAQSFHLDPVLRIGVLDPPPAEAVFGTVADALIDDEGRTYVLDPYQPAVRVFDRSGSPLFSLGSRGSGPGEFRDPRALEVDTRGRLYVLDPPNARIEIFQVRVDRAERTGSFPLAFSATGMCALGDRLFLLGLHEGQLIHEVDGSGRIARSFGVIRRSENPMLNRMLAGDIIRCDPRRQRIVVGSRLTPDIHVFSATGERLQHIELTPFRRIVADLSRPGVVEYRMPDDGPYDVVGGVAVLSDGGVVVQVGRDSRDRIILHDLRTFVIPSTLRGASLLSSTLPVITRDAQGRLIGITGDPYPRVVAYRPVLR